MHKVVRYALSLVALFALCAFFLSPANAQWYQESAIPNPGYKSANSDYGSSAGEVHAFSHNVVSIGHGTSTEKLEGAGASVTVTYRYSGTTPTPSFNVSVNEVVSGVLQYDYYPYVEFGFYSGSSAGGLSYQSNPFGSMLDSFERYERERPYVMTVYADSSDPFVAHVTFSVSTRAEMYAIAEADLETYFNGEITTNASVAWGLPY